MYFAEELNEIVGKTIAAAHTDDHTPRLLLVFTDATAAVVCEDTSGVYYAGETGGMMVDEPYDSERQMAEVLLPTNPGENR